MSDIGEGAQRAGDAVAVREAFENMPLALVAMDGPEHTFVAANAAYRAIVGREDIIGKPARDVAPEVAGQQLFEMLDQVYSTGETVVAREWRVQLNRGDDGEPDDVFLDMTVLPRQGDTDETTGLLVYIADVTERVRERQTAQRRAAEAERRYEAARDVVAQLQDALLPTALPVLPGATIGARYLVASQDQSAGGDWFSAVPLPDGSVALVVGDIVGHGVTASAAMGQLRTLLDEALRESGDLDHALGLADRMATRSPVMRAATVCAAILNPATGAVQYATCGHPPPLIVDHDGHAAFLPTSGGGPLGTGSDLTIANSTLAAGAVLVLYSDGLVERAGKPHSAGMQQLAAVAGDAVADRIMPTGGAVSPADRVCQLGVELLTRQGYDDDITVLAAHRKDQVVAPLHLTAPARASELAGLCARATEWLGQHDASSHDMETIDLVVSELVANSIEHAFPPSRPGHVHLDASVSADGVLHLQVADDGTWQEPSTPVPTSGRGLWLTESVVDQLRIQHSGSASPAEECALAGTTVRISHRLHRPAALATGHAHTINRTRTPYSATIDDDQSPRVIQVTGPIDITTAADFADTISTVIRGGLHPAVINLAGIETLASAGVTALFTARDQLAIHGQTLTLHTEPDSIAAQVLDLVGIDHTPTQ